jgi:universal stress protein E
MLPAFNPVCHKVKGGRRDEIRRLAHSLEADLVVVGTAPRSGLTALFVDSAAETVTDDIDCSVPVVKPPGFITPVVVEEP